MERYLNTGAFNVYDYEMCDGEGELRQIIEHINTHGYTLISVTQHEHTYTVFFRRPACG